MAGAQVHNLQFFIAHVTSCRVLRVPSQLAAGRPPGTPRYTRSLPRSDTKSCAVSPVDEAGVLHLAHPVQTVLNKKTCYATQQFSFTALYV